MKRCLPPLSLVIRKMYDKADSTTPNPFPGITKMKKTDKAKFDARGRE